MKYFIKLTFILITLTLFFFYPNISKAQEETTSIYNKLVDTLNSDNGIYTTYYEFSDRISAEGYKVTESDLIEFHNFVNMWNSNFVKSKAVYGQYITNSDTQIAEIARMAQTSTDKGILATDYYNKAYISETDSFAEYFDKGDNLMIEAVTSHDKAVDLYNSYSGYSSSIASKNLLIGGSVFTSLFSIFLLFKSRKKSISDTEALRSEVYNNLFKTSLWLSGGLIITTIGYINALENGGEYYIFWGAILIGGWQLLRGLFDYFTNGRKVLSDLNIIEKNKVLREAFEEDGDVDSNLKRKPIFTCKSCGSVQPSNRIICKECGENML